MESLIMLEHFFFCKHPLFLPPFLIRKELYILGSSLFISRNLSLFKVSGQGDNILIYRPDSSVSLRLPGEFNSVCFLVLKTTNRSQGEEVVGALLS